MLQSIHFQNFKSLRDTTLPLEPCTILVGPNGSGKSTVLEALEIVAGKRSPSHDAIVSATMRKTDCVVAVGFTPTDCSDDVQFGCRWPANGGAKRGWLVGNADQCPFGMEFPRFLNRLRIFALDATRIAAPCELRPQMELARDGFGLAGVLTGLRDRHEDRFEALVDEFHQWLPEFDRIRLDTEGNGNRFVLLRGTGSGDEFPAASLSDGTLLALAVLTLAHLPQPPSLIGLEEPDRGMHPYLLRRVKDALYRLACPERFGDRRDPVQVIATTHSPYFLDEFKEHPERIVLADKERGEVRFHRLDDLPRLREVLGESALGEVWYTGILGGVPEPS